MKKVYFRLIITGFFYLSLLSGSSQYLSRIDSMERLLDLAGPEEKAGLLKELSWAYHSVDPEKGLKYGTEGLVLCEELADEITRADILLNMGANSLTLNRNEDAIDFFIRSLKIKETLHDSSGIAAILNNLGTIFKETGNYPQAQESYRKALEISRRKGNRRVEATLLANIAITYRLMNENEKSMEFQQDALSIRQEIGDLRGMSASLNNIAIIYADSSYRRRDLKKAMEYIRQSMELKEKMGDQYGMSQCLINIGQMHAEMREFGKAGKYFSEAMSIARELGFVSVVMICYQNLANMYASTGDYKNAYTYHLRYSELHDSLYTVESSQRIAEIQIRYETEKKEQENELLKQESKIQALQINKQQNIRNFLIAFVMLFMGMAIAFYSRYLLKKRTNRLLEEKNRQLGLLNATKDKFFSIIAHDLKNPFGTLLSVSEQLKDRFYELNDEQKMRIIELISHSALLTHNLLENLLEWSVLQTGDIQVRPAKTDLAALVRNTAAILKLNSDRKGLTIETFIPQPTYVIADEEMISTVLRNLLTNAIKFSEKPGIIKVTCVDTGDQAEVSLEDEGIGINQEDLEKLFRLDINHRKIGRSKEKGTGLGLILCKEFIEKNGGKIYAQSTPGKGSIFIFTLPKFKD